MKNVPFKRSLVNRNGGMWGSEPGSDEFDVLCIRVADFDYENLKTKASASTVRSITEKQLQKNQLHDGDILLEKSGGGEKTPVGRAVYYSGNDDAICSNFIERLTVNQQTLNPKFACYILSAAYSQRKNLDCIKQTTGIQNLSVDDYLSSVTIPLFDIETQKRITKWLDKQLSKVAQVITAKQAQLQKLSTYRQSLITRAVTKGLDGDHQTSFIPLKYLAKLNPDVEQAMSDEIEYLPMEKVKNGMFLHHSDKLANLPPSLNSFEDGDILLAKVTPCFENGNICLAENCKGGVGRCSTELFVLRPNPQKVMPKFLMLLLQTQSFKQEAACQMRGTGGLKRIPADWLCNYKFPIPSLEKQKQIVEYMASKHSNLDGLTKIIKDSICLLNDYRSSLISAAVTGQLAIEEAEE